MTPPLPTKPPIQTTNWREADARLLCSFGPCLAAAITGPENQVPATHVPHVPFAICSTSALRFIREPQTGCAHVTKLSSQNGPRTLRFKACAFARVANCFFCCCRVCPNKSVCVCLCLLVPRQRAYAYEVILSSWLLLCLRTYLRLCIAHARCFSPAPRIFRIDCCFSSQLIPACCFDKAAWPNLLLAIGQGCCKWHGMVDPNPLGFSQEARRRCWQRICLLALWKGPQPAFAGAAE